ncbi:hypothetical protein Tco_0767877 [Tanacetum coccineum]
MTTLPFADTHNLVAFLDKPAKSEGFEQIVDFLNASSIRYVLTINPTIYTSCIQQFWATAKVKTVNREVQLQALVDGKKVIITETILDLETTKTAQAKEIASLKKRVKKLERKRKSKTPAMKRLYKVGRSAQVVSSEDEGLGDQEDASKQGRKIDDIDQDAKVTLVDETQGRYDDAQMFDTDVFNCEEVFVTEQSEKVVKEVVSTAKVSAAATITTEEITLAQALAELSSVKPKLVVQEPVQSTTTTTPSTIPKAKSITFRDPDESTTRTTLTSIPLNIKDKGKAKMTEPEKPLKMKEQIRLDEERTFKLQVEEEEQARLEMIEADRLLAERLQAREQDELTDEEKARLFIEPLEKRKKHFAPLRVQDKRNKPPTKAQKKSTMSTYLKHMAGYKQGQLKNKSFVEIQKLFDKAMKRVNMFVDMDTKLVKESSKKAKAEMAQESSSKRACDELKPEKEKKQKTDDDQEEAEMKKLIKVIPDDEEVAIDAIPLATKPPSIVDWKIVKEGKISLFQIIRANGSSKRYSSMIQMLRDFDREDLETLWKLVKAKHGSTRPEEGYERVLWGDLRTMFEHNVEDTVGRNLLGNKVLIWKLFDSCRVHFVRFQDMHLFMLVEKRYPLTPATITEMLNKKRQTDHLNEMFTTAKWKLRLLSATGIKVTTAGVKVTTAGRVYADREEIKVCFKIIGYPTDFGKNKSNQSFKGKNISNNNSVGTNSSSGFTDEQMATLIFLIKENKIGKNVQANMAWANQHMTYTDKELDNILDISHFKIKVGHPNGTEAFISKIGNLKLSNGLTLYDVLVILEYYVTLTSVHKLAKENKVVVAFDENKCYLSGDM